MTTTQERIALLADFCSDSSVQALIGDINADSLGDWVAAELGRADALDTFAPHGPLRSKAIASKSILHIVSGNTPHAALQSLLRGLLVGAHNLIKLPSSGLPEFDHWLAILPKALVQLIEISDDPTEEQWQQIDTIIAIGSDATMEAIQEKIKPHQTFIPHGHKVSIGVVTNDYQEAAKLAAKDVCLFYQQGCLSLHTIYVRGNAAQFAGLLAHAMQTFSEQQEANTLSVSEAGAIRNLRETTRFAAANNNSTQLWESKNNLDWTVIYQDKSQITLSCLNRCVYVQPYPDRLNPESLGPETEHLSTIAIHPFNPNEVENLTHLPAHRFCPLGMSQQPSLFWHHDGLAPLASLVNWKDIG